MEWLVYTPLELRAAQALEADLDRTLKRYLDANPNAGTFWSCMPSTRFPEGGPKLPGAVRTVFFVDEPADALADDPLCVTMLRLLIERSEALIVDWGEERESGADALKRLAKLKHEPALYATPPKAAPKAAPAPEAPPPPAPSSGKRSLAERVVEAFFAASEDMERGIELKEALLEASAPTRSWLEHVIRHNAADDAVVDRALKLSPEAANRIHREVEAMLKELHFG